MLLLRGRSIGSGQNAPIAKPWRGAETGCGGTLKQWWWWHEVEVRRSHVGVLLLWNGGEGGWRGPSRRSRCTTRTVPVRPKLYRASPRIGERHRRVRAAEALVGHGLLFTAVPTTTTEALGRRGVVPCDGAALAAAGSKWARGGVGRSDKGRWCRQSGIGGSVIDVDLLEKEQRAGLLEGGKGALHL